MKNYKALFIFSLPLILSSCGGSSPSPSFTASKDSGQDSGATVESSSTSEEKTSSSKEGSSEETTSKQDSSEESSSKKERETYDGIKVYCDKIYTNIYAWIDEGGRAVKLAGDWPGASLKSVGEWKYYEFPNRDYINLIFNNSSTQTSDLSLDEKGVYYYHNSTWYLDEPTGEESSSYTPENPYPAISEKNYLTFYQLLVYSFADGNNDGIGDFKGIIDHLDYLKDLGIGAIWLSPVQPSDSYHSYDCTDYYSIKSSYEVTVGGKKYDFSSLLDAAHNKGIKIVMDMVLNHTSYNHTWYREHPDWYGRDNKFGFPEFDFDKTEVRTAIKDVGKYWLNKGVDGFRLDAAYWVYNSGARRDEKNFAWWQEFSLAMKETKEDCYLVGEVLDTNHDLAFDYTACGFDSTFDFEAPRQVYDAFNGNAKNYAKEVNTDQKKIDAVNSNAIMARQLSNHDIGRFSQEHPTSSDVPYYIETPNQLKIANALNILSPGNAYIYYGDELGLKGSCPQGYTDMNYRTPMPFEEERTDSTKYFENFKGNGVTSNTTLSGKSISEDKNDPLSIFSVAKKAIAIKNTSDILKKGRVEESSLSVNNLVDYKISYNGSSVHFYCNTSKSSSVAVDVNGEIKDAIYTSEEKAAISNGKLTLPACSIVFIG
ncbi:MAG: starch-binding protein [Bacilli bacterium]|nr:starch-binding protein [Bacilli bacterium]